MPDASSQSGHEMTTQMSRRRAPGLSEFGGASTLAPASIAKHAQAPSSIGLLLLCRAVKAKRMCQRGARRPAQRGQEGDAWRQANEQLPRAAEAAERETIVGDVVDALIDQVIEST